MLSDNIIDKKGGRGRPFVKGQSGNPTGRPKGNLAVKELLKANSLEAAQKVVDLLNCGIERIEFAAAQEILNRTEGKPLDNVDMKLTGNLDFRSQIRDVIMERFYEQEGNFKFDRE